ncbi:MAG: glycine cleavage system aminomethyltransferase GcvT [Acidaminococcaceae bacterium]
MEGKKTPLFETHVKYGGKIVEFGGWLLPVQYSGIIEEHNAVRNKAGLFDVSHMGEIWAEGKGAFAFLQNLVTNDLTGMQEGQIRYSPMCYQDGGTVDDLLVYKYGEELYLLVVNAANIEKDWNWMQENSSGFEVILTNKSNETAQLALQGPAAVAILAKLTDAPVSDIQYYHFLPEVMVAGKETLVSRTGYTGEDGYEIYCAPHDAAELWEAIMAAGKEEGILPAGLGCRDTLRFESCLPLYGHELSAEISPLMAGLGRFVKLDKEAFNGLEALRAQKAAGLSEKVMGVEVTGRGIARAGYQVKADGKVIGSVTTGSPAPTLGKNMALALIDAPYAEIGREIAVEVRGKDISAVIVAKPFYKRG